MRREYGCRGPYRAWPEVSGPMESDSLARARTSWSVPLSGVRGDGVWIGGDRAGAHAVRCWRRALPGSCPASPGAVLELALPGPSRTVS